MHSGCIEEYKKLTLFRDLKDFNNHFEQWMIDLKDKFTKSETVALKRLVRFSASIQGVCYAKIQTIVAATHKLSEMGGISRSTFERMLRKAKLFGLIEVINTKSKSGRQAHNVYVFQPYKTSKSSDSIKNEVVNVGKIEVPNKSFDPLETSNIKKERKETLDYSFTSNRVPIEFVNYVQYFYNDRQTIEELFRVVLIQTRYLSYYTKQNKLDLALNAFKQLIRNIKSGRKIKNIFGYYWGIISNLLEQEYSEIVQEMLDSA
jgi:predicted transcriptional regulator